MLNLVAAWGASPTHYRVEAGRIASRAGPRRRRPTASGDTASNTASRRSRRIPLRGFSYVQQRPLAPGRRANQEPRRGGESRFAGKAAMPESGRGSGEPAPAHCRVEAGGTRFAGSARFSGGYFPHGGSPPRSISAAVLASCFAERSNTLAI